jgi:hypothetical protein
VAVVEELNVMQKLVTIYLENSAYTKGKMLVASYADKHGLVEEYLRAELTDGWRITSLSALGGHSDSITVRGWLAVVLEKP